MNRATQCLRGTSRPAIVGQMGLVFLLILASVYIGLEWPFELQRSLAIGILWLLLLTMALPLLQIGLGVVFLVEGRARETTFRMCVFTVSAVTLILIGVSTVGVRPPLDFDDLRWYPCDVVTWHWVRRVFLLCVAPLLSGLCVHSALYAFQELWRLPPTRLKAIVSCLVLAVLALGLSGAAITLTVTCRVQNRETRDLRDGYDALWNGTDRITRRFINEYPGDYRFLLLRANYLQDAGRTSEASMLYRQVCEATNTPLHIRERMESELEERHQQGLETNRP